MPISLTDVLFEDVSGNSNVDADIEFDARTVWPILRIAVLCGRLKHDVTFLKNPKVAFMNETAQYGCHYESRQSLDPASR